MYDLVTARQGLSCSIACGDGYRKTGTSSDKRVGAYGELKMMSLLLQGIVANSLNAMVLSTPDPPQAKV